MSKNRLIVLLVMICFIMTVISCGNSTPTAISPSSTALSPTTSFENKGQWTTFTTEDGLSDNIVVSITQDNQGILWLGTSSGGLAQLNGSHWENYPSVLGNTGIICATRDKQGNLWFGTGNGGAYEYTGKEWQSFTPKNTNNGLPGEEIAAIFGDNQGNIWFATIGNVGQRTAPITYGVTKYNGADWTSFLDRTFVTTIFQDNKSNLWFGTSGGVTRYDGSHWQTFTTEDGLADNYVVAITQDNQGNMWFGTWANGVCRYDGKNWRTFTPKDGLGSDAVHCMLKDKQGNLWFGSYSINGYYGISCFNGTRWQNFDPWQGKDDNKYHYNVISIFQDDEGNLWFGTSIGLVRYIPG